MPEPLPGGAPDVSTDTPLFGELLRHYRLTAGLTQEALAERAGVSARAISDLERDGRRAPRADTVALLVAALGLSAQAQATFEAAAHHNARALVTRQPLRSTTGTDPLVGRTRDLAAVERFLDGDGPPLLLLAGEPGIGKSRLLREAAAHAAGHGLRVLAGGCLRRGGQEPFAPLLDALEGYIRGQSPAHLRADLHGCAWLVRLLPELADGPIEPLPSRMLAPEQERRLMTLAVKRFLANVAGPAGTLLILDDLQWAGADALDLLATLVRVAAEVPLRVVGAYRTNEVGPHDPLAVMLADLAHAGLAVQRIVGPLMPWEAEQLLDLLLEGGENHPILQRAAVVRRTGGVPFFIVSYAQELRRGDLEEGDEEAVPWTVAQSIRQRVAALPAAVQRILDAAAVAGRVVEPAILAVVMQQPEQEVLAALDVALRVRLLAENRYNYQFAHDLIREVIEADVGAARRKMLHRHVAGALEQVPGDLPVERLAYHYTAAGLPGQAIPYWQQSGEHAIARSAHVDAVAHLSTGLELLATLQDTPERTQQELLLQTALGPSLLYTRGMGSVEVERTYNRALELCRQIGDTPHLLPILRGLWEHYEIRADLDKSLEVAEHVLSLGQKSQDRTLLLLGHDVVADTLMFLGDFAAAEEHAEQGLALYDPAQHRHLALWGYDCGVACQTLRSWALWPLGYPDQAVSGLHGAFTMAQGLSHPFTVAWVNCWILTQFAIEAQRALELAEGQMALLAEYGFDWLLPMAAVVHGWALAEQGHTRDGLAEIRRALLDWQTTGSVLFRPMYLCLLAKASSKAGQVDGGLEAVQEALALSHRSHERWWDAELLRLKGELLWMGDSPDEAERHILQSIDVARRQQAKSLELRAVMSLSRLWQSQDRAEKTRQRSAEARRMLADVYGWFSEGLDSPDLRQAQTLIAELA
jgi:transcriptional regulator with XRE-family HTH domain/predicted ATPase